MPTEKTIRRYFFQKNVKFWWNPTRSKRSLNYTQKLLLYSRTNWQKCLFLPKFSVIFLLDGKMTLTPFDSENISLILWNISQQRQRKLIKNVTNNWRFKYINTWVCATHKLSIGPKMTRNLKQENSKDRRQNEARVTKFPDVKRKK